ncbi:MAG: hypothetical protein Q8Q35_03715 [Nanoarchaeota archaeon]|nr:hypothetical protein [Nanoarchaeota archaeon]
MTLPRLVRRKLNGSGMLWEDTQEPARDGRLVRRIGLPTSIENIGDFVVAHRPTDMEIPEGYGLGYRINRETERTNGTKNSVYVVAYIVARR